MGKERWAMIDGQREMLFSTCIYAFIYLPISGNPLTGPGET